MVAEVGPNSSVTFDWDGMEHISGTNIVGDMCTDQRAVPAASSIDVEICYGLSFDGDLDSSGVVNNPACDTVTVTLGTDAEARLVVGQAMP